ncbi:hypothetical protein T265_15279, partial [Opisthorchis viverrini]
MAKEDAEDKLKERLIDTQHLITNWSVELNQDFETSESLISLFLEYFYQNFRVQLDVTTREKFEKIASFMSGTECPDSSLSQIQTAALLLSKKIELAKRELQSLELAYSRYQDYKSRVDQTYEPLAKFVKSPQLDPNQFRLNVKPLELIKKRHSRLRENLQQINSQLKHELDADPTPSASDLETIRGKIAHLNKRKTVLETQLSGYMGLSPHPERAQSQLDAALAKMNLMDSTFRDKIGLDRWC